MSARSWTAAVPGLSSVNKQTGFSKFACADKLRPCCAEERLSQNQISPDAGCTTSTASQKSKEKSRSHMALLRSFPIVRRTEL